MKHFITFEGIDGCGKSTISKLVCKKLKSKGLDVVLTSEPTDSWIGKQVKKCIESNVDPFVTTFVFIADRINHNKQIQKWLESGKIVLCDRYVDSTYAYQAAQLQHKISNPIKWLKELSKNHYINPDRTFIFVINPKDSLARIKNRNNLIPFERAYFLEKVQKNYLKLASEKRFMKIDATKSIDEIVDICCKDILY
ncbi:MAG: dTMP kinase [Candidatus Thermoplasmatota archaeon]|jgi:dTMP kinase|nr:dTMP kinase [Candidatus Thermoplasmatota archaeon]